MDPNNEVCFDGWTLDLRSGELCREGVRVRLQTRPQQLLEELLAQPGELVAREHLIARLWPRGVVDFDTALNSTVRRLRTVLGDHAESPRYIETIPRRGYRFIGRLGPTTIEPPAQRRSPRLLPHWSPVAAAVGVLALALATTVTGLGTQSPRDTSVADVLSVEQSATEVLERARYFLQRRQDSDLERAELYFNEALASKPDLADAWAGLASVHWLQTVQNQRPLAEGLAQTRFAAERALQLDPLQPEARLRLANYWWLSGDRAAGDRHFARALAAAPGHGLVLSFAASRAADEGRLADAIAIQRRAVAADP
jgi:DNA-binding winged helix-turn-helix (wHTH) protein/Tfp pilus assembly protein PilF